VTDKFERFDALVGKVMSVSHEELKRREKQYQKKRQKKKRAKTSPASRVPDASS